MSVNSSPPSPRIPIDTCEGLFEKLKWDHQQLQDGWTEYCTFNFVVTAYHLYADWIDSAGALHQKRRKNKLPDCGKKLFFTLRDLTNASKHWKLDSKGEGKRIVSGVSGREIADWYSYFIAGPVIYVLVNGARPSLPELAELTLECLDWILQGEDTFPPPLAEKLETAFRPL